MSLPPSRSTAASHRSTDSLRDGVAENLADLKRLSNRLNVMELKINLRRAAASMGHASTSTRDDSLLTNCRDLLAETVFLIKKLDDR